MESSNYPIVEAHLHGIDTEGQFCIIWADELQCVIQIEIVRSSGTDDGKFAAAIGYSRKKSVTCVTGWWTSTRTRIRHVNVHQEQVAIFNDVNGRCSTSA